MSFVLLFYNGTIQTISMITNYKVIMKVASCGGEDDVGDIIMVMMIFIIMMRRR